MGAGQGKHLIRHIILSLYEEVGSQSKALEKQNQIRLTPSFQKKRQQSLGDQHEKQLKKKKSSVISSVLTWEVFVLLFLPSKGPSTPCEPQSGTQCSGP